MIYKTNGMVFYFLLTKLIERPFVLTFSLIMLMLYLFPDLEETDSKAALSEASMKRGTFGMEVWSVESTWTTSYEMDTGFN